MPSFSGIDFVLLDIEGTICSISFVKDVLFPYALKALPDVLARKWDDDEFKPFKDDFPAEVRQSPEALEAHVQDLTKRDVKAAYLKNLQGYLWETGYKDKEYATQLFPDVQPRLQAWKDEAIRLAIYSSGSVFAQKLLFQHVIKADDNGSNDADDLTGLISGWFDTINAGPKTEPLSYLKIAQDLDTGPERVVFLSDNIKEIRAAFDAGLQVVLVDRPGNAPLSEGDRMPHALVTSLDQLELGPPHPNRAKDVPATHDKRPAEGVTAEPRAGKLAKVDAP